MPSSALLKLLVTVLSLTVFLSGCFKSPSPEVGLQELRAQAEERLLQDGKLAFVRADYPEAVLLLNRFVRNHRQSKLASEAQWWLARSYEQSGNLRLALGRFQRLAQESINHPYRHEARLRAQTLIEALGIEALSSKTKGVSVGLSDLQGGEEIAKLMTHIHQTKGAVLLINFGCPVHDQASEIIERHENGHSSWGNRLGRGLGPLIEDAFQAGQTVYLGVSLPCLGLFATGSGEETPQWHDWSFEPRSQRVRRSPYFSLLSSGYQNAMFDILSRMSRFKIAGIVFQEDVPLGPYDGLSPIAINSFEEAFDLELDPSTLFVRGRSVRAYQSSEKNMQERLVATYSDVFWKWAGWKSRERLRVMNELMQSLREQFPHLQFGVEIHPESLHAPVHALANYSEDWVEAAQASFDFFVTRVPDYSNSRIQSQLPSGPQATPERFYRSLVQRMVDYLEDPQKVWVIQPEQGVTSSHDSVLLNGRESQDWPEGVGEILDFSSVP